jgi:hypothetical protein
VFTLEVLFERTRLSEWEITDVTHDWSLTRVDLQVVQEIAFLFEDPIASHANQDCVRSTGL